MQPLFCFHSFSTWVPRGRAALFVTVLAATSLVHGVARAAEYYVAVDGDDGNAGTEAEPFQTVGRGQQAASAGDTVWVRGGTWSITSGTVGVAFNKAGQVNNPIRYFAYPGETPVFDLSGITNPSGRITGFDVHTNYVHIKGMEITGVPQYMNGEDSWGLRIQGNGNVIEMMNVHHNEAPGIFITSGADNLVLNCDSHHNYDVLESGGSGDGFGCHSTGAGNVIRGCRGWYNSDDGYDFINAPGGCTVENSWAWNNGYIPDTSMGAGNGAGFKAGGFGTDTSTFPSTIPRHTVQNCLAFGNRSQGFYANHHPGGIDFFNNTALQNAANFDMLADVGASSHTLRNNLAFGGGGTVSRLSGGTDEANSWNLGVDVSSADFVSEMEDEAEAPRQSDGGLPDIGFMHLVEGSDLIDQGEDVGLEFAGDAPDLGCFEFGLAETEPEGTAGAGGTASGTAGGPSETGGGTSGGSGGGIAMGGSNPGSAGEGFGGAGPNGDAGNESGGTANGGAGGGPTTPASGGSAPSGSGPANGGDGSGGGPVASAPNTPSNGSTPRPSIDDLPLGGAAGMPTAVPSASTDGVDKAASGDDAGCGCRLASRNPGTLGGVASLLLALCVVRRKRRASVAFNAHVPKPHRG